VKIICFSATASFSAGFALLTIGAITVRRTNALVEAPYAAIPMIFGVQQLVEGSLWLGLPAQSSTTHVLTTVYLLFSNVLWPIYVPLAVCIIEPSVWRRKQIILPVIAGAATGIFFLVAIITHPVSATLKVTHIKYHLPHPHHAIAFTFYAVSTCLAPLLSSHKMVRLFGIVLIASMIAAYIIYSMWFASVWCFFAALTSGIVFLHFSGRRTPRRPVYDAVGMVARRGSGHLAD
jgi:uncharacterized protein DUF6629